MKITEYKFGLMAIDDKIYRQDLIIFPDRIQSEWWRDEGHKLQIKDIHGVIEQKPEYLIIGTGKYGFMKVDEQLVNMLNDLKIKYFIGKTFQAVRKFNEIPDTVRKIAAFHLTC